MGLTPYEIIGNGAEWRVRHDGKAEKVYETKEAAFEAAVAAGSLALRQAHEVPRCRPWTGLGQRFEAVRTPRGNWNQARWPKKGINVEGK